MKKCKIIVLLLIVSLACATVHAQEHRLSLNINYSLTFPTSSFREFAGERTWRDWTATLLYDIDHELSAGLGTGFHDFYRKFPRAVYHLPEGGEISAVLTNSIQTVPVLATVKYNFITSGNLQPYIAAGIGGNIIMHRQYLGEYSRAQSDLGFALRPEAGVYMPMGKHDFGININGIYNYMPYGKNNLDNLNSWGLCIGARIPLR